MARSGRKRSRGTWFPIRGTNPEEGVETSDIYVDLAVPTDGSPIVGVLPVTFDAPAEQPGVGTTENSLADIIGSEYILRRIVGKIHASGQSPSGTVAVQSTVPPGWRLACGFFVARAQDEGSAGGEDIPIGGTNSYIEDYNPLSAHCIREPWIWRRTWNLGNLAKRTLVQLNDVGTLNVMQPELWFPGSTSEYGSVADGPHIDAKTARRVSSDDRLWVAFAVRTLPFNVPFALLTDMKITLDIRLFGSLRRARNRGNF